MFIEKMSVQHLELHSNCMLTSSASRGTQTLGTPEINEVHIQICTWGIQICIEWAHILWLYGFSVIG